MNYFLAISLAAIFGCLLGIFGTSVYYTYYVDDAEYDVWDDSEK